MNDYEEAAAELSFEEAYSRLEQTVEALENGELSLDQAIDLFQQGMELAKFCSSRLDSAELRIRTLQAQLDEGSAADRPSLSLWSERKG